MKKTSRWASALFIAVLLGTAGLAGIAGCRQAPQSTQVSRTKQYPIHGTVVQVDEKDSQVTLQHEAIPGLMEAMTMDYPVTDKAALSELHPGDRIFATLLADPSPQGPVNLRLSQIVITAQARPDYKPAVIYHVPEPGQTVPNFKLLDQSDKTINLDQYRGKVLLMTFIYTRCPLSDYCPRMSHYFAQIDQALAKDPKAYDKTHLLSVSFDPTYDTPKVLKSYGGAYTGEYSRATFKHWTFAAPQGKELLAMEKWFAVGVTPGQNGTLQHSLATTVIGKDGKVIAFYPSNDWSVTTVLAQLKQAAAQG